MVFHGRLMLKVISAILLISILSIVAFCLVNARSNDSFSQMLVVMMLIPCAVIAAWANTLFGFIRIDDVGIFRKTLLGQKLIPWSEVGRIKIWSQVEHNSYSSSKEYYALVTDKNSKKIILIKSSYDEAIFPYLHSEAQKRELLEQSE